MKTELYCPNEVYQTVFDIDYHQLWKQNKNVLLFDIDNTLLTYLEKEPSEKIKQLFTSLYQEGFQLILASNNSEERVSILKEQLHCTDAFCRLNKPSSKKLFKIINNQKLNLNNIVMIGDQILTDISCGNKLGIHTILVKSLDRSSEHWYTTINRLREKRILKKIKTYNNTIYNKIININKI